MSKVNAGSILSVAMLRACLADRPLSCLPLLFMITPISSLLYRFLSEISTKGFPFSSDQTSTAGASYGGLLTFNLFNSDMDENTTINISPYCIIFNSEERRCCRG